ncbi:thiol peroxidase [Yeosuana sp. MJ-SS3]|uniref:Thiol peroxidase n=1 Tax=Gilvirhabdus luticola TaxID=3079858 RepID=A0ABU3U7A6_9FLAO|nr:thiol peroxidase [Yeosuana sp. MJ-SS3]MDU8886294.1 thiol peroxidase [Yeosuana sp. MJ-SS3]
MATVTLKGNPINTKGNLPSVGSKAPNFELSKDNLSDVTLDDYKGSRVIMNIFHSIDTGTCAASVREFNKKASELANVKILCISKDLPFAMARFCGAEGIENVETLSDFRNGNFGDNYNLTYIDGPIRGLLARSIIVLDQNGKVLYTEQVQEVVEEPNYQAALDALKNA